MKLNKNQLDVLFDIVAYSRAAGQFWRMVCGKDFDAGEGIKPYSGWQIKEVENVGKSRTHIVSALRQLADTIESNRVGLDPDSEDALKLVEKLEKKVKGKK